MRWMVVVAVAVSTRAEAQPRTNWELQVPERLEITAGSVGTLPITIEVDSGKTISKDADLILDLAPEPGISIKRRRLGRSDAVDPDQETLRFSIPLGAANVGDYAVRLRLRFWLCGTKVCRPIDARRTVYVSALTAAERR